MADFGAETRWIQLAHVAAGIRGGVGGLFFGQHRKILTLIQALQNLLGFRCIAYNYDSQREFFRFRPCSICKSVSRRRVLRKRWQPGQKRTHEHSHSDVAHLPE